MTKDIIETICEETNLARLFDIFNNAEELEDEVPASWEVVGAVEDRLCELLGGDLDGEEAERAVAFLYDMGTDAEVLASAIGGSVVFIHTSARGTSVELVIR